VNILDADLAKGVGNYIARFALVKVIVNFVTAKHPSGWFRSTFSVE
jgi:hypothetical protein